MKKFLSVLMAAGIALTVAHASAETASPAPKKVEKKVTQKKAPAKKAAAKEADEPDADVTGSIVTEYGCAGGHQITVFRNPDNPDRVAMRWGNKITTMKRVETASGAERLEHEKRGLVFIGIPAKSMLLDTKKGRQLANDCMSPEQVAAAREAG